MSSLFAEEEVRIVLSHEDEKVSLYRWKRGESGWTTTENSEILTDYDYGDTDEYHIQASYDGEKWSADHAVVITTKDEIEAVFSWAKHNEEISFFRWRMDGGEWNIIDSSLLQIRAVLMTNGRHVFEVCGSYDGVNWSEPASVLLTAVRVSPPVITTTNPIHLEATASFSLSSALYDFYNGHDIAGARYLMKTDPSFTADGELLLSLGKRFRLFAGYAYSRERKKETVIPDAFVVEHHQAVTGFDVLFPFKDKWRAYMGIGVAYSVDVNAGYWSPSFFLGGRIGLDYFISEHFYVGIKSGVRVAHNDAEDPLYRSYTYLMDPIGIKMGVKF